jgi:type IV pilus assembly protein PilP
MTRKQLRRNNRIYVVIIVLCITAAISGCSKKEQPSAIAPATVVKQPVKPVQKQVSSTVKLTVPAQGNQFDFSSKKDPFKPLVIAKAVTAPTPADLKKALLGGLPIHSFDVSQFRLIGIITGGKENQAMVVDPNGKGYVLKSGMSIGKNDGRIVAISAGGVDVLEQFKDDNGRVRKENIRITLPRKQ